MIAWLSELFASLLNYIFGCSHSRTTFPITPSRRTQLSPETSRQGTYVVCLDCGKEFDYNWKEMRVGNAVAVSPVVTSVMTVSR
jgi:predicted transcriptional regulator